MKERPLKEEVEELREVEIVLVVGEEKGETRDNVGWEARMVCAVMAANAACIEKEKVGNGLKQCYERIM